MTMIDLHVITDIAVQVLTRQININDRGICDLNQQTSDNLDPFLLLKKV